MMMKLIYCGRKIKNVSVDSALKQTYHDSVQRTSSNWLRWFDFNENNIVFVSR